MSKMKIMTVLGTRPEIIRLSRIIPVLDQHSDHLLVHTGQNYDDRLNKIFFEELGVRDPDVSLGIRSDTFGSQIGQILTRCEELFLQHLPDRLLVLGDTNSGLCALVARRLGMPVYHMEAGNRCYDDRVPEEVNRRVIDHSSTVLMPYTHRSKENLLREGIPGERIYVTGNPIKEVIDHYQPQIDQSKALENLGVEPGKYFLVTLHRAENVDVEVRLRNLVDALAMLHREFGYPVICSFHPRSRAKGRAFGINIDRPGLRFVEPFGFFEFIKLEKDAFCLLTDSGTVQEEACIFGVPNVTIRDVTERPETVECGSNILSGADPENILKLVRLVTDNRDRWSPPPEYLQLNIASTVCRILLSYNLPDPAEVSWSQKRRTQRT
jgi:UDP-N-acetylglucosamine 2-epimerase (non-hydrolysing)